MVRTVLIWWAVLAALLLVVAVPRLGSPGLYYDEAFLASQAKDFVEPQVRARHPAGARAVWIAGRPFPWMNVAYLGALKSQLLIPSLAGFGAGIPVLRITTLLWSLLALLLAMLWARRILGVRVAVLLGVLVAADPTYLFISVHEWGPFTTGFLCRAAGLLGVTSGWSSARPWRLWLGAFVLGLGVYSRADFVLFLAAAGAALLLARPRTLRELLGPRLGSGLGAGLAFVLGAAPMILSFDVVLSALGALPERGGLERKLDVAGAMLDGSYFHRLMEVGGRFDLLGSVPDAPAGIFGWLVLVAATSLALRELRRARRGEACPAVIFVLATTLFLSLGLLFLPGATRIHHLLAVLPFPHLLVATGLVWAWRAPTRGPAPVARATARLARGATALVLGLLLLGNARVTARTYASLAETGGRGWWSDSLVQLANELRDDAGTRVVSLDWGFQEPLLFLTRAPALLEPIWALRRGHADWTFRGDARTLYLLHAPAYDRFGFGPRFLESTALLDPELVQLREHRDRAGEAAFLSVRLLRPHLLRYTGDFEVHWR